MGMARVLVASCMVLSVACTPSGETLDQARKEALRAEVQETLSGLTQAMNSHDPEQILEYYQGDDDFLYLGCTEVVLGWDAFTQRVGMYYLANPEVTFHQETTWIQILGPTVAVAALRGGSSKAENLFWTEVLVKGADGWKVSYEHESWPGCPVPSAPHPFTGSDSMTSDTLSEGG